MLVRERNITSSRIKQMNSRTSFIHFRDFHAFMHFLSDCGKFLTNSWFEEIAYQAKMCSVSWIKPVLPGNSYNMSRSISEVDAEAINMLFQEHYFAPLISEQSVEQSKPNHIPFTKAPTNLKNILQNILKCKNNTVLENLD